MFDWLAKILGYVMKGCSFLAFDNYVVALLFFAIAMQLLLCIFGVKQQKNMVRQAKLRPKEMAIYKKYKGRNDQVTMQKMRNEIMELYQKEGYSQFAGCLPMILQLIIVFPLYQVVIRPLEFITGLGEATCQNIVNYFGLTGSAPQVSAASKLGVDGNAQSILNAGLVAPEDVEKFTDAMSDGFPNLTMFGVDLGIKPWDAWGESYWWLILIPLLNLGVMYLSQFISKKLSYQNIQAQQQQANSASTMKYMMLILPLMTMGFTFGFAAAIGVYWIFRTLLSMLQQFILYKAMPYPEFTEEDYRKAERDMKGQRKSKKSEAEYVVQPGEYRSLHHIDD